MFKNNPRKDAENGDKDSSSTSYQPQNKGDRKLKTQRRKDLPQLVNLISVQQMQLSQMSEVY